LAEALLKKMRPDWVVESAGVHTAIPISEDVRKFLMEEGAEQHLKKAPEDLDSKPLSQYDLIVVMEQRHKNAVLTRCSECMSRIVVWNIRDPYFMSYDAAVKVYLQINNRVKTLAGIT
jgi:protein-tyrosine-phosphatase